jgi:Cu/Ag efflux protein CusF
MATLPRIVGALGITAITLACHPDRRPEQRYHLIGTVVAIEPDAGRIVVDHKEIPGFMGAMTMPYMVKDRHSLEELQPRDTITADVVVRGLDVWLEHVVKQAKDTGAPH